MYDYDCFKFYSTSSSWVQVPSCKSVHLTLQSFISHAAGVQLLAAKPQRLLPVGVNCHLQPFWNGGLCTASSSAFHQDVPIISAKGLTSCVWFVLNSLTCICSDWLLQQLQLVRQVSSCCGLSYIVWPLPVV